jgi:predicted TIM-barrel fold metal-dependent hydrolase
MIIDAHMHLWKRIDGQMGEKKVKPLARGLVDIDGCKIQGMPTWFTDCRNSPELAIAAFDDAGVDAAVVTQEYLDGNQNDYLLSVSKKYPDRFFVHGLLDFRNPRGLKKELRKVLDQGFKGIKCPAMFLPKIGVRLDGSELMAVWGAMADRNMVLSIDLAAGDLQVPEMKNVLKTFPKLKVAIGHFGMVGQGNWLAQIRLAEYENVYVDCGGIVWLYRQEGPPFKNAQMRIRRAVQRIGARKIMWGSDYPRTMVDFTYRQSLDFAVSGCDFLTESERADFLGKNAAQLYGLKGTGKKPNIRITEI